MNVTITIKDTEDGIKLSCTHSAIPDGISPKKARADSEAWEAATKMIAALGAISAAEGRDVTASAHADGKQLRP